MNLIPSQNSSILDTVGNTPLVGLNNIYPFLNLRIFGKLESFNPGGSIKDRTAYRLISQAIESGELKPGNTVIESSSGNMAVGLAQTCLYFGVRLIVVVDPLVNQHTVKILKAYGAKVDQVKEPSVDGGFLNARLERVQELLNANPGSFWPNQYGNPQNPLAHKQTMDEIVKSLDGKVDYLFAATSTCGTLMGCAAYAKEKNLSTKIIAVDAFGSVIFGPTAGERKIPGHGAGRPSQFLRTEMIEDVVHVSDEDCVNGCRDLLQTEAILGGGSSGAVVRALLKYADKIPSNSTCALILCDRGERYLDTVYNDQWVQDNIRSTARLAS